MHVLSVTTAGDVDPELVAQGVNRLRKRLRDKEEAKMKG